MLRLAGATLEEITGRALCLKYRYDFSAKLRNAVLKDVPDRLVVHAEVVVYQTVAHTSHGPPFHRRVLRAKFRGTLLAASPLISRLRTTARLSVSFAANPRTPSRPSGKSGSLPPPGYGE